MRNVDLEAFCKKIGYSFSDSALLTCALTHSSFAKLQTPPLPSNERLEFLGDAVLELVVTEYLYSHYPITSEGAMTKIRARTVCGSNLSLAAQGIHLPQLLFLSKSEEIANGRHNPAIAENAMEALIGAVYLDGGYECARTLILSLLDIDRVANSDDITDYKSTLQVLVQEHHIGTISYEPISKEGPDHKPVYRVSVTIGENVMGFGSGKSKKEAEQNAAKEALSRLQGN